MLSPFGILALFGKGYTLTHMVAEGVTDLNEPRRVNLVQLAALEEPNSTGNAIDNTLAQNDNHCDINTSARDVPHRSRVHSTGEQPSTAQTAGRDDNAGERKEAINNKHDKHISTIHTTPARSIRLRGGGSESQEELDALETLSHNGGALFRRIVRKTLVMMYNESTDMADILDRYSLINVNSEVRDEDVSMSVWQSYGPKIIWKSDEHEEDYSEADAYSHEDYETEDDTYYDANESWNEWAEGDVYIGALTKWNYERNYGIIVVVDDYSPDWNMTNGEIFCHGTKFVDGDDCILEPGCLVWFTVTWDYERSRWHAVDIYQATLKALDEFMDEHGMNISAQIMYTECTIGQEYDGP